MIVIKRDGREVEYDKSKIINAINKANAEVVLKDKVSLEQIDEIITSLEKKINKKITVESIQDFI